VQIKAVDHNKDLFAISDVFDVALLKKLHSEDLLSYEWQHEQMQSDLLRRKLKYGKDSILQELDSQINNKENLQQLSDTLGKKAYGIDSNFWLDLPGYTIGNHPDNPAVRSVIQIFLWPNHVSLGTEFFHNTADKQELDKQGSWTNPTEENTNNLRVRKKFDYVVNTGYIMENRFQVHGMTTQVPKDSIRFSLYGHIGF